MLNYKLDGNDLTQLRKFCILFATHLQIEDIEGNEGIILQINELLERTNYAKLETEFKKDLVC